MNIKPLVPVGPRYGWVIVATLTVLLAASHGLILSGISVFDSAILEDLGVGRGDLKFRDLIQLFSAGLWALAIGIAADKLGARTIIYVGLAVLSAVLFAYGYVTSVEQIYGLHFLLAFAYSSCHVVVVLLILSHWFEQRRSAALGIILAGESLGGTILPLVIVQLIGNAGWRDAMHILALMPIGLAVMLLLLLRGRPEHYGQRPLGSAEPAAVMVDQKAAPVPERRFRDYLLQREMYLILLIAVLLFYAGGGFVAHSFLYFQDQGFGPEWAASSLSLIFIAAFLGKFSGGILAERWPATTVWIFFQLLLLVGGLCLTTASPLLVWPGVACLGFGWGCCYTLTQAIVMERFRGPYLGRLSSITVLAEGVAAGLGSFLAGSMHDATGSYLLPFAIMCAAVALAIVVTFFGLRRTEASNAASAVLEPSSARA